LELDSLVFFFCNSVGIAVRSEERVLKTFMQAFKENGVWWLRESTKAGKRSAWKGGQETSLEIPP
jgi:hypothetical protein